MGVSGCGKSEIAKHLAAKLPGFETLDADQFHSSDNWRKITSGIPLARDERLEFVREVVKAVEAGVAMGKKFILSWSALREEHRQELKRKVPQTYFIHLDLPRDVAFARSSERKAVNPGSPHPGIIEEQFQALEMAPYALLLDATKPREDIVCKIVEALAHTTNKKL